MKKLLSLISLFLAIVIVIPIFATAAGNMAFSDVKAGDWFFDNVKYVFENGIMNGASATKFDPYGTLTRGMCAAIIYRMAGSPDNGTTNKFADVKPSEYYSKAVAWAYGKGIVNGRTATVFDPNGLITRAEFATMLYRFLFAADLVLPVTRDGKPADASVIPAFASDAVIALFRAGVINGRGSGAFDPYASVTRAETAAMIERFIKAAESKPADTGSNPDPDPYTPTVPNGDELDIAFFGNSYVWVPETPNHFKAIAEGKHDVKVYNRTRSGWSLKDFYEYWGKRSKAAIAYIVSKWDVIVLNETADSSMLQSSGLYYKQLTKMFGEDKEYYNLCGSTLLKDESKMKLSDNKMMRTTIIGDDGNSPYYQKLEYSNKWCFEKRDWLKENCNVNRIMLNLAWFDPDNPLDPRYFDYLPEDFHPNRLYGYCHALALYCTIFNEPCIEQNNGILKSDEIPGNTPAEKEAFMIMLKNHVQEQLDFQKAH
ncbi:MAG: S-layer homology domain-containing protein [Clostridia bacterium]|nr:S-layer homology domain-containing protein [Clostridia bacterium]